MNGDFSKWFTDYTEIEICSSRIRDSVEKNVIFSVNQVAKQNSKFKYNVIFC